MQLKKKTRNNNRKLGFMIFFVLMDIVIGFLPTYSMRSSILSRSSPFTRSMITAFNPSIYCLCIAGNFKIAKRLYDKFSKLFANTESIHELLEGGLDVYRTRLYRDNTI
jgi:hypothetical protein